MPVTPLWLAFLPPLILWLNGFWELHFEWDINEQYTYGIFVPFLAAYLLYLRWQDRPFAEPQEKNTLLLKSFFTLAAFITLFVALFFPANVDWRPLHWLQGLTALGISTLMLYFAGGRPWVRHFIFPLAFLLVAIPWPRFTEKWLIDGLMEIVASITVDFLNFFGIFANRHGSVITLMTGAVNVAEACSGVRSFQSTLMGGLFLGELFRLRTSIRLLLVVTACALAFGFNIIRTLWLTYLANVHGPDILLEWHDPAGYLIFGGSFSVLLILAYCLRYKKTPQNTAVEKQATALLQPKSSFFIGFSLLFAIVLPLSYTWYTYRESSRKKQPLWTIDNKALNGAKVEPLEHAMQAVLMTDNAETINWEDPNGGDWRIFVMEWNSAESGQIAGLHNPGQCLPASGWRMIQKTKPIIWSKDGVELTIECFTFQGAQQTIYVFDCQWDPSGYSYVDTGGLRFYADRFRDVWHGNRKANKRTVEAVGSNFSSMEKAAESYIGLLEQSFRLVKKGQ